jgi:predicted transposase YdaD
MVLTIVDKAQEPDEAKYLLNRTTQEASSSSSRAMIKIITTIMVYEFEALSREEVESMLGITIKETRVYREIKQEGREENRFESLSLEELESLGEALLDFSTVADLANWLIQAIALLSIKTLPKVAPEP